MARRVRASVATPPPGATPELVDERRFQQRVEQLAKFYGWTPYHTFDSRRSAKGMLDLAMYRMAGQHGDSYLLDAAEPCCEVLFAELKVGKRKLTDEQQGWLTAFQHAGMEAYEWRWPDAVPHILKRLARGRLRVDPEWAIALATTT